MLKPCVVMSAFRKPLSKFQSLGAQIEFHLILVARGTGSASCC